jgi:2-aminoadipate transaminase
MALFEFSTTEQSLKVSEIRELMKLAGRPGLISFAGGMPDARHFPAREVAAIINAWGGNKQKAAYQYGPTRGYPPLLRALYARMAERGVSMTGQEVITTTGAQGAIYLVARVLLDPGDRVVVESPTFIGALASFAACRARLEWVPLQSDGMDMAALEKKLKALARKKALPKFIYTIPNFQNPAGISMSRPKRKRLLFLAHKFNVPVLEDDPYGELYFSGKKMIPCPSRRSRARAGMSFTSTLSPKSSPRACVWAG